MFDALHRATIGSAPFGLLAALVDTPGTAGKVEWTPWFTPLANALGHLCLHPRFWKPPSAPGDPEPSCHR